LNGRSELTVVEAWGSVQNFERFLNGHPCWTFLQKERRLVNGVWLTFPASVVLLCGRTKVVLSPPTIAYDYDTKRLYYYFKIVTVRTASREDRVDALAGREVKETIQVEENVPDNRLPRSIIKPIEQPATTPAATVPMAMTVPPKPATEKETKPAVPATPRQPSSSDDRQRFLINPTCPRCSTMLSPARGLFCQGCGVRLPAAVGVHHELVVVIKKGDYEKLATHLKQAANAAWSRLMKGRRVDRTLNCMGQNIFLIVVADEMRTSTLAQEEELNDILTETGIGRVTTDPYEISEAHKMLHKQNQPAR
jgi:hypothetical protein